MDNKLWIIFIEIEEKTFIPLQTLSETYYNFNDMYQDVFLCAVVSHSHGFQFNLTLQETDLCEGVLGNSTCKKSFLVILHLTDLIRECFLRRCKHCLTLCNNTRFCCTEQMLLVKTVFDFCFVAFIHNEYVSLPGCLSHQTFSRNNIIMCWESEIWPLLEDYMSLVLQS